MSGRALDRHDTGAEPPPAPTENQVAGGLRAFVALARFRYGAKLKGVFLFGSRARGDNRPDSDADVAVVLTDGAWSPIAESVELANETFEILLDFKLDIQPRAIAESHWANPDIDAESGLLRTIVSDARRVDTGQ